MRREDGLGTVNEPVEQQGEQQAKNLTGNLAGKTVWVMTDGKAGMENQCLGLAEALIALGGEAPIVKRLAPPVSVVFPAAAVLVFAAFDT